MANLMKDYEKSLIGSILNRPGEMMVRALDLGVRASWFEEDVWSLTYSALLSLWERGEIDGVNVPTIMAEARRIAENPNDKRSAEGVCVALYEQAVEMSAYDISTTARLMRNGWLERMAKKAIADAFKEFPQYADSSDVLSTARGKLDKILGDSVSAKKISSGALFDEMIGEYREANEHRVEGKDLHWTPGLKMPWPKMTEFMNGFRPGLHVVAARPSVGKTSFAVNLMRFWCDQGIPVVFCSLDMPQKEVMRRFVAEHSRVSVSKALFSPTKSDLAALEKSMQTVKGWPLTVVECHDVDDLKTVATVEKQAGRCAVLVVDYLQLLHSRALGKEDAVEYARISYVSDTLKRLANSEHLPVVALAQLNRESTKQDQQGRLPGLADLRGSGSIEQDAFTVTILHRDAGVASRWAALQDVERARRLIPGVGDNPHYNYNFDDLDPIWWIMCKAQNGPTGKLPFVVRKKYFCWMLGDWQAEPKKTSTGYGATAREVIDNSPKFERVHSDWRHDPIEKILREQLALIQDGDVNAVANVNDDYPQI